MNQSNVVLFTLLLYPVLADQEQTPSSPALLAPRFPIESAIGRTQAWLEKKLGKKPVTPLKWNYDVTRKELGNQPWKSASASYDFDSSFSLEVTYDGPKDKPATLRSIGWMIPLGTDTSLDLATRRAGIKLSSYAEEAATANSGFPKGTRFFLNRKNKNLEFYVINVQGTSFLKLRSLSR